MSWRILHSRTLLHDRWIKLRSDACLTADGRIVDPFYVLDYPDWMNAVAVTEENQIILQRTYRHGWGQRILELPSGTIDPTDESPEAAMQRELLEETGYFFPHLRRLALLAPNPDKQTNRVYAFLASGGYVLQNAQPEASEDFRQELVSLHTFRQLLHEQQFLQTMHVSTAFYALPFLEKT